MVNKTVREAAILKMVIVETERPEEWEKNLQRGELKFTQAA